MILGLLLGLVLGLVLGLGFRTVPGPGPEPNGDRMIFFVEAETHCKFLSKIIQII